MGTAAVDAETDFQTGEFLTNGSSPHVSHTANHALVPVSHGLTHEATRSLSAPISSGGSPPRLRARDPWCDPWCDS